LGCYILCSNDYDDGGNNYYYYTYLDIVTFIKGYGPMNVVNFASNQTTGSYTNGLRLYNWDNGGGIFFQTKIEGAFKILTIKDNNDIQYTTLNANALLIDDAWTNAFGDKYFIAPYLSSDYQSNTLLSLPAYLISKDGTILDSHTFTGDTNSISISTWNSYNTLYIKDYQHSDQAVYVNENNTFTAIGDYNDIYTSDNNYMGRPTYNTGSGIALVSSFSSLIKCINATGVTNEFSFPGDYDSSYGINTGKDYFSFNYVTTGGAVGFNIYDYSGNTIQTLTTTDNNSDESDVVENRVFISTNNGSTKNLHLFTATGQQSAAYTYEYDRTVNDVEYYWC
jgi:hypothetical protein